MIFLLFDKANEYINCLIEITTEKSNQNNKIKNTNKLNHSSLLFVIRYNAIAIIN